MCSDSDTNRWRIFAIDLVYPAVLGSLIVLIFLRISYNGFQAFSQAGTLIGICVALFFCAGFVNSKLTPRYGPALAALDIFSVCVVFVCFYFLNFNEFEASMISDTAVRYDVVYFTIFLIACLPSLRRYAVGHFSWLDFRNALAALLAVLAFLAMADVVGPWFVVFGLTVLLIAYARLAE